MGPVELPDANIIIGVIQIVAGLLSSAVEEVGANLAKRRFKPIAAQLEAVFFSPDGTVGMINEALEGKVFTDLHVQEFAQRFNADEERVGMALLGLAANFEAAGLDAALKDKMLLHRIEDGKVSIRREIREKFYFPLVSKEPVDLESLTSLRSDIEEINAAIAELDDRLRP